MRITVPCAPPHSAPPLAYSALARATRAFAAWLVANFGQPSLTEEEAYLAASTDHADCERRERVLARGHRNHWRMLP